MIATVNSMGRSVLKTPWKKNKALVLFPDHIATSIMKPYI